MNPCVLSVANLEGQEQGLVLYVGAGPASVAWGSGSSFLCVKAPTQRTGAEGSGGTTGACDGVLTLDWNAFVTASPSALGSPFSVGDKLYAQGWYRDPPASKSTNFRMVWS